MVPLALLLHRPGYLRPVQYSRLRYERSQDSQVQYNDQPQYGWSQYGHQQYNRPIPAARSASSRVIGKKIVVLEPRRVAAKAAARRMAAMLGEQVRSGRGGGSVVGGEGGDFGLTTELRLWYYCAV